MTKVEKVLNKLQNQDATIVFKYKSAICYRYKDMREHERNTEIFIIVTLQPFFTSSLTDPLDLKRYP